MTKEAARITLKWCPRCGCVTEHHTRGQCKPCGRKQLRSWTKDNPERTREYKYKMKYGMTIADYDALLKRQGGCCAICGKPAAEATRRLVIDHDHASGQVRGLLCDSCNIFLGYFEKCKNNFVEFQKYIDGTKND